MSVPDKIHQTLTQALIDGDETAAEQITRDALNAGVDPLEIIQKVMVPALSEVGNRFQSFEIFLPELMMSGKAAEKATLLLDSAIEASGGHREPIGVIVIGTVQGDVHEIGKNIVATMLKSHGFKVIDLGRNVAPSAFLSAAEENKADVIAMSSLMTTTRPAQLSTVNLVNEVGARKRHRIIVGGGCVDQKWADEIGADGYAPDAVSTVDLCKRLLDMPSPK
jgi:5-methyltetrahydrofolate--homocysteine methyltransferase